MWRSVVIARNLIYDQWITYPTAAVFFNFETVLDVSPEKKYALVFREFCGMTVHIAAVLWELFDSYNLLFVVGKQISIHITAAQYAGQIRF